MESQDFVTLSIIEDQFEEITYVFNKPQSIRQNSTMLGDSGCLL